MQIEDLDAVLTAKLHPAVQAMQALLPSMRKAGWGVLSTFRVLRS
ncbi:hypothetical protein [Cupriavidus sp. CP313]